MKKEIVTLNKKLVIFLLLLLYVLPLFASSISFSGGKSALSLKEGDKSFSLSDGAEVISGSIKIESDSIYLTGEDWRYVECKGKVVVKDTEKQIEIRTESLWYDREEEIIVISTWFEIDDGKENLYAQAGSLHYDIENEKLEMAMSVKLLRVSDNSVMTTQSEALKYNRKKELVILEGNSKVNWKDDNYSADVITVNLTNDEISLKGRIKGTING